MTPQQLKAELDNAESPLAADYAAPLAAGNDTAVAALLDAKTFDGYVPARHIVVALATYPVTDALTHWVLQTGTMPDGSAANFAIYTLLRNLDRVARSVGAGDLKADKALLAAGLTAATAALGTDLIPAGFGTLLLAGEVKLSRAEVLWGYGASVSESDVAAARRVV